MQSGIDVADGYRRTEIMDGPAGPIEVKIAGEGPAVVLIPSLGRGADDFDDLSVRLADHGYMAVAPEPRGIGASTGPLDDLSMFDLAADTAAVIKALDVAPAPLVGHAFGNRVARMTATEHPELVESVVLLACGGLVPAAAEHLEALQTVFMSDVSDAEHQAAVATAFFAPDNDASVWFDGWHRAVSDGQTRATTSLNPSHWWQAGQADVLVVQPEDDVVALPANASAIVEQLGDRATLVTIPRAGHALLPEQPEAVAAVVLEWLSNRIQER
ncbi:MAG: alpha/beta hydrolase [Acidimicrobiia bacterium]|nr:alpha/beta hydrolase [Acidimicrobiia bacterium]MYG73331.1 alpha/beta hydrolase [Acidimicrobiia bacterium]